jgi:hypothetical protein
MDQKAGPQDVRSFLEDRQTYQTWILKEWGKYIKNKKSTAMSIIAVDLKKIKN